MAILWRIEDFTSSTEREKKNILIWASKLQISRFDFPFISSAVISTISFRVISIAIYTFFSYFFLCRSMPK